MMLIMTPEIRDGSRALPQVMKAAVLLCAALITINGCTVTPAAEPAGGESVQVRKIAEGGNALDAQNADTVAAFDDGTFRSTWSARVGTDEPPRVDFSKEAVVFVFGGMRNTGGYSVDIRGAKVEGETLVLDAVVEGPPAGAIVTQVITYPYAVVAVTPRAFRSVRRNETAKAHQR
jgi:hypothetical protein